MNKNNQQITIDDARAALESLDAANQITVNSMRPPSWLIILCAVSLGIKTLSMGLMTNNSLWNSLQWGSYIVCCLSVVSWIIALRAKGITVKVVDVKITNPGIISALVICVLLVLSRATYLHTGNILYPCIAGMLNTFVLAFSLHFNLRLKVNGDK